MKKNNYIFSIFTLLVSACLFIPLIFYPEFRGPFQTPQTLTFYLFIELALPFFLFILVSHPELRPRWKDPIILSFLLYLIVATTSAVLGVDPLNSFVGNSQRMDSILFLWHCFIFLLYLNTLFRLDAHAQNKALRIFLIVAGVCGLIGILQVLHLMPILNKINDNRASSTIGNPIFFAATLIIPFFISIGTMIQEKEMRWKRIYGLVAITTGFGIIASGTRGAFLGLAAGCLIWAMAHFFSQKKYKLSKKNILFLSGSIILIISCFFFVRTTSSPGSNLFRITHVSDTNVSNRLAYWKLAVKGWEDHPWLGVGYQNFFVVADKYYSTDLYATGGTWPDKPHNQLLEILVTGGALTFSSYLLFLFFVIKKIINLPLQKTKIFPAFLLSAMTAYIIQNLFGFDTITPLIAFTVLVAIITSDQIEPTTAKNNFSLFRHTVWIATLIPFSLCVLLIIPVAKQLHLTHLADKISDREQSFQQLELIRQQNFIYDTSMLTRSYYTLLNKELGNMQEETNLSILIGQSAATVANQNLKHHPLRANDWYLYSIILTLNANAANIPISEEAFVSAQRAISLAPVRIEAKISLANMYDLNGDYAKALNLTEEAIQIAPKNADALWTLATLSKRDGVTDHAASVGLDALKKGVKLHNSDSLNWLIDYYVMKNNTEAVVFLYEKSIKINPEKIELLPKLAAAYAMNGQTSEAIETAKLLLKMDPRSASAVESFIKSIQK